MPTYEFRCPQGHDFEEFFRKISDAPMERPCPQCGQVAARMVSGGAGLHFKGSGFYITDYKKSSSGRSDGSDSDSGRQKGDSGEKGSAASDTSRGDKGAGSKASGDSE